MCVFVCVYVHMFFGCNIPSSHARMHTHTRMHTRIHRACKRGSKRSSRAVLRHPPERPSSSETSFKFPSILSSHVVPNLCDYVHVKNSTICTPNTQRRARNKFTVSGGNRNEPLVVLCNARLVSGLSLFCRPMGCLQGRKRPRRNGPRIGRLGLEVGDVGRL